MRTQNGKRPRISSRHSSKTCIRECRVAQWNWWTEKSQWWALEGIQLEAIGTSITQWRVFGKEGRIQQGSFTKYYEIKVHWIEHRKPADSEGIQKRWSQHRWLYQLIQKMSASLPSCILLLGCIAAEIVQMKTEICLIIIFWSNKYHINIQINKLKRW